MRPRPPKPVTTLATRSPRAHVRARVACRIEVPATGEATTGPVLNLNPEGLSADTDRVLPADAECEVLLRFGGDPPDLRVKGWVVYADARGLAVQFDHLSAEARLAVEQVTARFLETA